MAPVVEDGRTWVAQIFPKVHGKFVTHSSEMFMLKTKNRGKVVQDRIRKEPKLNCRNWECGVLVPITESPSASTSDEEEKKDESNSVAEGDIVQIFSSMVPVPMRVPAPSLGRELKPWYGAW